MGGTIAAAVTGQTLSTEGLVVVPCHNEEASLPGVMLELGRHFPARNILFVDDGSRDGTARILSRSGFPYLSHPLNLGYREAMITGMRYALEGGYTFAAFFDGDGQHRTEDLLDMIRVFQQGECDFVIGSRFAGGGEESWSARHLGSRLFALLVRSYAGVRVTDVTCGMKLISRSFLGSLLALPAEDFHAELIVALARAGARLREVPVRIRPRASGSSMYDLRRALLYPTRTLLCLLGGAIGRGAGRKRVKP